MALVLVVDDEATVLKNMAHSLRRAGFEVLTAADCANARAILSRKAVDALCLDIILPDGNGLDLLEEVRQIAPGLPAIVMSSAFTPENRSRAARLGVEDFLPKPFPLTALKATLDKLHLSP